MNTKIQPDRKTKIYILSDPLYNDVRYVGITVGTLERRLNQHISECNRNPNSRKSRWISSVMKEGRNICIEEVDECLYYQYSEFEQYWIAQFKSMGFILLNETIGGKGASGYIPLVKKIITVDSKEFTHYVHHTEKDLDVNLIRPNKNIKYVSRTPKSNYQKSSEPSFIKLYISNISMFNDLSHSTYSVLIQMLKFLDYEGIIELSPKRKRSIYNGAEVKEQTFKKCIQTLIKKDLLYRIEMNTYMPNPSLFGKGSWDQNKKARIQLENIKK